MQPRTPLPHTPGLGCLPVPPAGSSVAERRPPARSGGKQTPAEAGRGPEEKLNFPLMQTPWGKGSAAFLGDGVPWVEVYEEIKVYTIPTQVRDHFINLGTQKCTR